MVYASPAAEQVWGLPISRLMSDPMAWTDVIHEDDKQRIHTLFFARAAEGNFDVEYRIRTPNGEIRWIHNRAFPIRDAQGKVIRLAGIAENITERKHLEKERARNQRERQQAGKMEALGQLAGGIAHEFNNMLAIILGHTELAQRRLSLNEFSKIPPYLENVLKAGNRAKDIVAQMMAYSHRTEHQLQRYDLADLIRETVSLSQSVLPSSIDVAVDIQADLPAVMLDHGEFQQVLMNLFNNARDAMQGQGRIKVGLRRIEDVSDECAACHAPIEGQWLEVSVSDNGAGIKPKHIEHIFDPFFSTKEIGKGTGLGLSVLQKILENSHGHILVQSKADQGATFRLLFPPAPSNTRSAIISDQPSSYPERRPLHGKALVVDDEVALTSLFREILSIHGMQVCAMNDSREALSVLAADPMGFDLLITDQTMPGMTGVELIAKAKQLATDLPVILCTGYSEFIDENNLERQWVDKLLKKPIEAHTLLDAVDDLLSEPGRHTSNA